VRRQAGAAPAVLALLLMVPAAAPAQPLPGGEVGASDPRPPVSTSPPHRVLLRSLIFPGWGQLENGQPSKAALVATVESAFFAAAFVELRRADRAFEAHELAAERGDQDEADRLFRLYEDRRGRAIGRFWWGAFTVMLSALDAYVDAHMRDFEVDRSIKERAAPAAAELELGVTLRAGDPALAVEIVF
jgi:hypothetical protein